LNVKLQNKNKNLSSALTIKKIGFYGKFVFATLATRVAARHASKHAQNVPRAWELSWRCNWLHAQLPMQHRNFSSALKIKKIRFCGRFVFATLARSEERREGTKHAYNVPRA